jgi:hypothetical protein
MSKLEVEGRTNVRNIMETENTKKDVQFVKFKFVRSSLETWEISKNCLKCRLFIYGPIECFFKLGGESQLIAYFIRMVLKHLKINYKLNYLDRHRI